MDSYLSLAIIIIILTLGLIAYVVYKESGWVLVKKHNADEDTHEERERERHRREHHNDRH